MRPWIVPAVGALLLTACATDEPQQGGISAETTSASTAATASTSPSTSPPATVTAAVGAPTTGAPSTAAPPTAPTTTSPPEGRTLFAFAEAGDVEAWANVDDTVMGGVSSSTTSWEAGQLVFSGELSLDNNGGFTSVRGPIVPELGERLADAAAIVVEATGDGKTYLLQVRTIDDRLYVQRFTTIAGSDERYTLPFTSFEPVGRFLDPLPSAPALEPSRVAQLVVYLLDKQEGPFRLAVQRIAAT